MPLTWFLTLILGGPAGFVEAPAYVPLFTPRGAPAQSYAVYTSPRDLDSTLKDLRQQVRWAEGNGSFEPRLEIALEAFGQSGGYNRWKLALLYGARRVKVARGPRLEHGRVVEAWTLVSPYPDPDLERLNPGTLLIVLRLAGANGDKPRGLRGSSRSRRSLTWRYADLDAPHLPGGCRLRPGVGRIGAGAPVRAGDLR